VKRILIALLALTVCWHVNASEAQWLTDLPKAQAQATAEHKLVLLDFTGSDWCPDCLQFKKEVFDKPEFQNYAVKNMVLVQLDFPDKKPQSHDLKAANEALRDKYDVEGYPTLVVLDPAGKEIGRQAGYKQGGPAAFIAQLEKFKAGK
jgi:thioredoxin-related protein